MAQPPPVVHCHRSNQQLTLGLTILIMLSPSIQLQMIKLSTTYQLGYYLEVREKTHINTFFFPATLNLLTVILLWWLCLLKGVFINPALVEPFGLTIIEVRFSVLFSESLHGQQLPLSSLRNLSKRVINRTALLKHQNSAFKPKVLTIPFILNYIQLYVFVGSCIWFTSCCHKKWWTR